MVWKTVETMAVLMAGLKAVKRVDPLAGAKAGLSVEKRVFQLVETTVA